MPDLTDADQARLQATLLAYLRHSGAAAMLWSLTLPAREREYCWRWAEQVVRAALVGSVAQLAAASDAALGRLAADLTAVLARAAQPPGD